MARSLRSMRKTILSPFFPSPTKPTNLNRKSLNLYCTSLSSSSSRTHSSSNAHIFLSQTQTRRPLSYVAEMRKSAFEGHILRLIRNEINYEFERGAPDQPVDEFGPFLIDDRPGEQWITLRRKFGENEDIKVEATMFDEFFPKPGASVPGDAELCITLVVTISKGEASAVLEVVCTAWPGSIKINKLFTRGHKQMPTRQYLGPGFKELDDGLQHYLYKFLEERGIDNELAFFLHEYMENKDKTEYIKWMETLKSFFEKRV